MSEPTEPKKQTDRADRIAIVAEVLAAGVARAIADARKLPTAAENSLSNAVDSRPTLAPPRAKRKRAKEKR